MKIKSFTLVEMMIALLVSSILVSIMASMYVIFSQSSMHKTRELEKETDIGLLYSALSSDMYKSEIVLLHDDNILEIDNVKYLFGEDIVVREFLNNKDSLRVRCKEIHIVEEREKAIVILTIENRIDYKVSFTSRKKNGKY
jgi:prepilin-type N-terminal cleavage/methylation domain-containing protein